MLSNIDCTSIDRIEYSFIKSWHYAVFI